MRLAKQIVSVLLVLYVLITQIAFAAISFNKNELVESPGPSLSVVNIQSNAVGVPNEDTRKEFEEKVKPIKDAWNIARDIVGTGGDCFYIVKLFTKLYFGVDFDLEDLVMIDYGDLEPGDIIYYSDGGLGTHH